MLMAVTDLHIQSCHAYCIWHNQVVAGINYNPAEAQALPCAKGPLPFVMAVTDVHAHVLQSASAAHLCHAHGCH